MIRENLKVAQSQQKSYTDKRRRDLSFKIGDFVYLKVSPYERHPKVQGQGKASSKICRSIQDP
jgi:exosome complex RNA-binding protein Rrp4